jgi:hypothetical protein
LEKQAVVLYGGGGGLTAGDLISTTFAISRFNSYQAKVNYWQRINELILKLHEKRKFFFILTTRLVTKQCTCVYVPTRYVKTAHEQTTDPSQAPRAHSCSAKLRGSFLNVKLHRSSLLQNQNRPEHHYCTVHTSYICTTDFNHRHKQ